MRPSTFAAPAVLVLLSLALASCGRSIPLIGDIGMTSSVVLDESSAAAAVSRYRARHGLGPVELDSDLIKAASLQAKATAKAGRLSHDLGGSFSERMAQAGFAKKLTAENLSAGSDTFDKVLVRWQKSPGHNQNMLVPKVTRIGIARVDNPNSRYKRYWAMVLAGD